LAKKINSLAAQDILKAVPFVNDKAKLDVRSNGTAVASIPLRKPGWVDGPLGWLLPYSSHRRIELDRLGMAVIGLCDGERQVEGVIEEFARRHLLSWRESQVCVMQFMRQVVERGLVVIVGLSPNDTSERK